MILPAILSRSASDITRQELKLKTRPQLECVLALARAVLARPRVPEDDDDVERVQQIEQAGACAYVFLISGRERERERERDIKEMCSILPIQRFASDNRAFRSGDIWRMRAHTQVLNRSPIVGINRKVQLKPLAWHTVAGREVRVLESRVKQGRADSDITNSTQSSFQLSPTISPH